MSKGILILRSSDGHIFKVEKAVAFQSKLIRDMMEAEEECQNNVDINDDPASASAAVTIPIPKVNARVLSKVLEYCHYHAMVSGQASSSSSSSGQQNEEEKKWDESFVNGMEPMRDIVTDSMMLDMVWAANYLNVEALLKLMEKAIADQIKTMKVKNVRSAFGIQNDLTPEEEKQIRRDNAWAFYDDDDD